MIRITSINNAKFEDYDEVWAIVRNPKNLDDRYVKVPELSPSSSLYHWYWKVHTHGKFDEETFNKIYVPRFINEMTEEGKQRLKQIRALDAEGKKIALICFCPDEKICHRSIIAGILQGLKVNVILDTDNDYSNYFQLFMKKHGKKRGS